MLIRKLRKDQTLTFIDDTGQKIRITLASNTPAKLFIDAPPTVNIIPPQKETLDETRRVVHTR